MKKTLAVFALLAPLLFGGAAFAQDHSAHHSAEAKPKAEAPKPQARQKKVKAEKAVLRAVTADEIGKQAACPVTGETLTVKEDTGSASYKGKTYYFCCPGCDKSFLANPEKYTAKKQPVEVKKVYACPMGDYQGDKPGKCPKCGMKLEEKK